MLANLFGDQILKRIRELVGSDDSKNNEFLEDADTIPLFRPFDVEWVGTVVNFRPLFLIFLEPFN